MWPLLIAVVFPAVESWFSLGDFQISFVQHLLVSFHIRSMFYETVDLNFVQKEPSLPGDKVVNVMQRIRNETYQLVFPLLNVYLTDRLPVFHHKRNNLSDKRLQ